MTGNIVAFPEQSAFGKSLAQQLQVQFSQVDIHRFPDGESCVRIETIQPGEEIIISASLYHPDKMITPLLFLAETLRDYGAKKLFLVAPYLAYMRQDTRFQEGQGISATYFAALISSYFDVLITVDPHLHRIKTLDEIYSIPSKVVHAAPQIADYIHDKINKPLVIGPDSESEQWVRKVAELAQAPYTVLEKIRHGDHDVEIKLTDIDRWRDHTPVLVDDIISTGRTMIETVRHICKLNMEKPVCIGIHGIFAGNALQELLTAGADRIITTNTILHETNAIDLSGNIAEAIRQMKIEKDPA